jgi:hypothetical protein
LGQALDNNQGAEDDADKTKQEQDFNGAKVDLMDNNLFNDHVALTDFQEQGF